MVGSKAYEAFELLISTTVTLSR